MADTRPRRRRSDEQITKNREKEKEREVPNLHWKSVLKVARTPPAEGLPIRHSGGSVFAGQVGKSSLIFLNGS